MTLATFLRLGLLLPALVPALLLAVGVVIVPFGALGLVLAVGWLYYGWAYALFAVGALWWLTPVRSDAELIRGACLAPLWFAPLSVANVVFFDPTSGATLGSILGGGVFWLVLWLAVAYAYAVPWLLIGLALRKSGRLAASTPTD